MPVTLCLGEALVDLIGEAPVESIRDVQRFTPHFGGVTANVAVFAARAGARVALAGAVGNDRWGRWLRGQLLSEGVYAHHFRLVQGAVTQLAFVAVDGEGEPRYELYHEPTQALVQALAGRLAALLDGAAGLFISSNTLAGADERALTMDVRDRALARGLPVMFDCNLRLHRWSSRADAAASANACVPGALLVRANRFEAELMTGEGDPERAAVALRKAGAELVVITLGPDGAILRGGPGLNVAAPAVPARMRSSVGAGDALTGTLLARLALSDFYPAAAAAALDEAVAAAAAACERWGALD